MTAPLSPVRLLMCLLALAGVVLLVGPGVHTQSAAAAELRAQTVGQPAARPYYALPGYWMLQSPETRKEIELVPEQAEKLKQIGERYRQQLQELYAPLRDADLSQEERRELYRELSEKSRKLLDKTKKEIEGVLLPHQVEALKMIQLRMRAAALLRSPAALERLGLTEEQKKKIQRNREELAEKLNELQKEYFEEILEILTPEQVEKLKQSFSGGGRVIVAPRGGSGGSSQ